MKNPFKELLNDKKLPEKIKDRVMADIELIRLSIDIADLFAVKFPDVFFNTLNGEKDNKNNPDDDDGVKSENGTDAEN